MILIGAPGIENPPIPVTVKVEKINPVVRVVFYDTIELRGQGDEVTAVRFTIEPDGDVTDINQLQKKIYNET